MNDWRTDPAFQAAIDKAAEAGADRALARVGLGDESAGEDIRDIRDLLRAWREARRIAWTTAIKTATRTLMWAALLGLAYLFASGQMGEALRDIRKG